MIKCVCSHEYNPDKDNSIIIKGNPFMKEGDTNLLIGRERFYCLYVCPKCKTLQLGDYHKSDWL